MTLPVTDTLKLILNGPYRPAAVARLEPSGQVRLHNRLDALFEALQAAAADSPADELEDEIWAIWTSHQDSALEARMQRAISAIARRRFKEAEELLDELVADAPDWAEAWNKRATLYFLQHRDAESIADIRRTLELEPRHFGAVCGFGQICLRHGEIAAAAEVFAAALEINPHLESVRAVLAELEPERPRLLN
jgi:Tfp pilus assembly protein PilF